MFIAALFIVAKNRFVSPHRTRYRSDKPSLPSATWLNLKGGMMLRDRSCLLCRRDMRYDTLEWHSRKDRTTVPGRHRWLPGTWQGGRPLGDGSLLCPDYTNLHTHVNIQRTIHRKSALLYNVRNGIFKSPPLFRRSSEKSLSRARRWAKGGPVRASGARPLNLALMESRTWPGLWRGPFFRKGSPGWRLGLEGG